ncbi:MAG: ABC transporter substrate-binding protein [Deltaproteobacteria bacterium]|nr:ABC transporter substrate-binding protein [Deltaproteobacteria bacterium]
MIRRIFISLLPTVLLLTVSFVEAQQTGRVYRIGFLRGAAPPHSYIEAFRQRLKELGYVEGRNIAVEYRWARGSRDQLPTLVAELLRLQVDVIVADGSVPTQAAKDATRTVPIVMQSGNPVELGLVASLARPGGNVTGLTSISGEMGGKLLELLKDIVPRLSRVAIVFSYMTPASTAFLKETETPARALNIRLIPLTLGEPDNFEAIFQSALKEKANGIIDRLGPATPSALSKRLAELATKNRLPAISQSRRWTEEGGLMTYGPDRIDIYRRFATYVDRILKGARPADLPVEQPTKFELVINLKTAKRIGLTIPPNVLARADKVIK